MYAKIEMKIAQKLHDEMSGRDLIAWRERDDWGAMYCEVRKLRLLSSSFGEMVWYPRMKLKCMGK
ncbi:unnamed protein product [Camellia sinensis]